LTLKEISNIREAGQRISATEFNNAPEVAEWMGAIQAQDYSMAKWAIGCRLTDSSDEKVEASFDNGEIIRTHVMRPTLHFISSKDIYWMIELTAPRIKPSLKSWNKKFELTDSILTKCYNLIEKRLFKGQSLTREEFSEEFNKEKIRTDENRLYHILVCAELDGIICSGPRKNGKHTYALLSERVPYRKVYTRDESLAELAKRYFTSHGPATLLDFVWWSGLSVKEAGVALESVKSGLISENVDFKKYWFSISSLKSNYTGRSVHLLAAFDEFLISYKDRSAALSLSDNKKSVSTNGIFYPVIIENGQVTGVWKRLIKKNSVIIEIDLFSPKNNTSRSLIEEKCCQFGHFVNKVADIKFKSQP
jgi:hypothetical protein